MSISAMVASDSGKRKNAPTGWKSPESSFRTVIFHYMHGVLLGVKIRINGFAS